MKEYSSIPKPIRRSRFRSKLGHIYYGLLRKFIWIKMNHIFARKEPLHNFPYTITSHKTPLLRKLKDVDMWYQYNKIINLRIASDKVNGVVLHPGEIFSLWKLIGKPTKGKGYVDGMILQSGRFTAGIGGGLCQLSNLIFWMTLHTSLTVVERHHHGYDVFPDSNRTQPFGSGATCYYPHGDLMIKNNTECDYQLIIRVGDEYLEGEWKALQPEEYTYKVVEKNHEMKSEFWGGFSRHNELYRQIYDCNNQYIKEEFLFGNSVIMMYNPFLTVT